MTRCTITGEEPTNEPTAPVPNDAKRPDGQHVDHWVMCPGEIIKAGYKRPVRLSYVHVGPPGPTYPLLDLDDEQKRMFGHAGYVKFEKYPESESPRTGRFWTQAELDKIDKGCGTVTQCPRQVAETYAAEPGYYGQTFCCGCHDYFPVGSRGEFVWDGTKDRVGT